MKGFPEWDAEHFPKVEKAYQAILAEFPENEEFRLDYAEFLLFREQDYSRAEEILSGIDLSVDLRFYRLAGLVAFLKNDYTKAVEYFSVAWNQEPKNIAADGVNLAAALLRSGDEEKAKEIYLETLSLTQDPLQKKSIEKTLESLEQGDEQQ